MPKRKIAGCRHDFWPGYHKKEPPNCEKYEKEINHMPSKHTTLVVSNLTEVNISKITTTVKSSEDWSGNSRPDRNFNDVHINSYDSRGEREELNGFSWDLKDGTFTMTLTMDTGSSIRVTNNQKDSATKYRRVLKQDGPPNEEYEIFQTSGHYTNAFEVRSKSVPDNSNWMRDLMKRRPGLKLNQITMPGSHDAGMYKPIDCSVEPEWTQTQALSILDQLKSGARYFDIRIKMHNGSYYCYHVEKIGVEWGCYGEKLESVLTDVSTFFSSYEREEVVILKFSHTDDNVNKSELVSYITDNYKGDIYKRNATDTGYLADEKLNNLSGKAVLVFDKRFKSLHDITRGIFPYVDCDKGDTEPHDCCSNKKENSLMVYDKYSDTDSYSRMRKDQISKLKACGYKRCGYLFLLSWTLTGKAGLLDGGVLSSLCRPWLPQILTEMNSNNLPKANIVYIDYIDPYICSAIIKIND